MKFSTIDTIKILLGNIYILPGLIILSTFLIISTSTLPRLDYSELCFEFYNLEEVIGTISDIENTSFETNGNKVDKLSFDYRYLDKQLTGFSYSTSIKNKTIGDTVTVEVISEYPKKSRIKGARKGLLPLEIILVDFIFLLIGGILFAIPFIVRLKMLRFFSTDFEPFYIVLKSKKRFLPHLLVYRQFGMIKDNPYYTFDFSYELDGKVNKISKIGKDKYGMYENEKYIGFRNIKYPSLFYVFEMLPNIVRTCLDNEADT